MSQRSTFILDMQAWLDGYGTRGFEFENLTKIQAS
jgi:hypothetical protein